MVEKFSLATLKDGTEAKIKANETNIQESKFNLTDYKDVITNQSFESLKFQNSMLEEQKVKENKRVEESKNKKIYYREIYMDMEKEEYKVCKETEVKSVKLDGINQSRGKKVDGIYMKDEEVLVAEVKSPEECKGINETANIDVKEDKEKNNWGGELQKYENELNKNPELNKREKAHLLHLKKTEVIADQIKKNGYFEMKVGKDKYEKVDIKNKDVKIAYTVPNQEQSVVENALKKMNIKYEVKSTENGTTFIIKR